jgi:hypothetical protein
MKHGCAVAAAATLITVLGLAPATVEAACNVRNPTACTPDSQPQAQVASPQTEAPQAQPTAPQPPTQAAAKPLQLKRYLTLGPARRSVSRSGKGRVTQKRSAKKTATAPHKDPPKISAAASAKAGADAALTPRAIPTVSISARALAVTPTPENRTVGFTADTAPWGGEGAFAHTSEPETVAPGVTPARFDELNEIDRAADATGSTPAFVTKSDSLTGVSLVTPANAAPAPQAADQKPERSWLSWLYDKVVDGVVTAALAIRSLFG